MTEETALLTKAATDCGTDTAVTAIADDVNNINLNINADADDDNALPKKKKKEKKKPPVGLIIPPKRPKLSKAERRELQEQQRAAKAGGGSGGGKQLQPTLKKHLLPDSNNNNNNQDQSSGGSGGGGEVKNNDRSDKENSSNNPSVTTSGANNSNSSSNNNNNSNSNHNNKSAGNGCLDLFSHLPQYREMPDPYASEFTETLHPDVIELGLKYASGDIQGDNERCRAMMECFSNVLNDYILPTTTSNDNDNTNTNTNTNNNDVIDFRHHFDHQVLKPSFQFWTVNCRPHSVSMGNAFTFLKTAVGMLDRDILLDDAKLELTETIERYLQERLEYADRAIAQHALSKIHNGDVLLTFGYSEVIDVLLKTAHEEAHIKFYVWIVDARPLMEGKRLLKSLRAVGISCGYIQLNALTYVMQKQVTKVFLGASALLVNGSIYGQIGTACIALLAKNHHVPVLVCCETYKISNKVQLESITQNELGNPNDLLLLDNTINNNNNDENVNNNNNNNKLHAANILYDVTPDKFISGIITELGIIPPTSVAVLLREMNMLNDRAY